MNDIEIRKYTSEDIPSIINLLVELSKVANTNSQFSIDQLKLAFDEMGRHPEIYTNLVACEKYRVVGFMSLIFYKTPFHKGGTALINELVVSNSHRGIGIGQKLVHTARKEAIERGKDELEVGTEITNLAAKRFYKRCGFDLEYVLLGMEF